MPAAPHADVGPDPAGPGPDDLVDAARAVARLARLFERELARIDLTLPQYRLLAFLHRRGGWAASTLADGLRVSRPSLTSLVDGLVTRGLVRRAPDPEDRRRVRHEITDAGARSLARADRALAARVADLAAHLDGPARARLVEGLRLLGAATEAARAAERDRTPLAQGDRR